MKWLDFNWIACYHPGPQGPKASAESTLAYPRSTCWALEEAEKILSQRSSGPKRGISILGMDPHPGGGFAACGHLRETDNERNTLSISRTSYVISLNQCWGEELHSGLQVTDIQAVPWLGIKFIKSLHRTWQNDFLKFSVSRWSVHRNLLCYLGNFSVDLDSFKT